MENNIRKEIQEIAPTLASLEKKNPFKIPDGYFSTLENRTLDALDKKPAISSTPSGYFDTLSDKVLERAQSEMKTKVIPIYKSKWLAIAASFIVFVGAGFLISTLSPATNVENEYTLEIEPEEALEYLIENENLYLSDLLTLDIYEDDITAEDSSIEEFNDTELEEFLSELDPEDLEELL